MPKAGAINRDPNQGRIAGKGSVNTVITLRDATKETVESVAIKFDVVGAAKKCPLQPSGHTTGETETYFHIPDEEGLWQIPVLGSTAPGGPKTMCCYACERGPVTKRLWTLCRGCRGEIGAARRGEPRELWPASIAPPATKRVGVGAPISVDVILRWGGGAPNYVPSPRGEEKSPAGSSEERWAEVVERFKRSARGRAPEDVVGVDVAA